MTTAWDTISELFITAILESDIEDGFEADEVVAPREILNKQVEIIDVRPFTDKRGKECAACLVRLPDGRVRVFFAGQYARRRPLIAARKNRLPMTMTLQAGKTLAGRTFYLFDGV